MRPSCCRAGSSLQATIKPSLASVKTEHTPPGDLEWIEREFAEMNLAMGYPAHVPATASPSLGQAQFPDSRTRDGMND